MSVKDTQTEVMNKKNGVGLKCGVERDCMATSPQPALPRALRVGVRVRVIGLGLTLTLAITLTHLTKH